MVTQYGWPVIFQKEFQVEALSRMLHPAQLKWKKTDLQSQWKSKDNSLPLLPQEF